MREALLLHDELTEGVTRRLKQGISIVDDPGSADVPSEPPICKVCLEPITDGPIIVCAVCNTPHHRDCWDYVGALLDLWMQRQGRRNQLGFFD